jgi:tetratricopeptide (TPR) repeat protein
LCAVLILLGKREEAQGVNAKILQLDPANEQARIRKAALLRDSSGEFESAIALLKDLLHASQDKASVHFQLGLSYRDTANLVEAERHFKLAAQLNPANWENWFQLANTQNSIAGNGPQPEAISSYRQAGEVALLQPVSSQRYAAALINAKEFELARQFLITSLDRYPENIDLHANLGLTYFSLSQNSAAIDAYKRVLSIDENRKDARCNLVLAFMADARYAEAISCLEHSAKEDLDQCELMLLARCQFNQGDFESTLRILQNYEATQPLTVEGVLLRGVSYESLSMLAEAISTYQEAIKSGLTNADIYNNLGTAESNAGNFNR